MSDLHPSNSTRQCLITLPCSLIINCGLIMCFFRPVVVEFLLFLRPLDRLYSSVDDNCFYVFVCQFFGVFKARYLRQNRAHFVKNFITISFRDAVGEAKTQKNGVLPQILEGEQKLVSHAKFRLNAALRERVFLQLMVNIVLHFDQHGLQVNEINSQKPFADVWIGF